MRMAVKALQQEIRNKASQEASRQHNAMEQAINLYNKGQYSAAVEGLALRIERKKDPLAMGCLAYIAWHGYGRNFSEAHHVRPHTRTHQLLPHALAV